MLGAIIGDIVGSYYEVEEVNALKNNPDKKRSYEERIKILDKRTPLFTEECSYTDDTVLTTAIASSLLTGESFEESLKEYGTNELSLGVDSYGRSRFGKGFVSWLKGEKEGDSFGNGASMRISPVGYYYDDLEYILYIAKEATIPSHNNPEAIKGAQAVATTIYLARKKYSKEEIKEFLKTKFGYYLDYNLEDLQKNYHFSSKTNSSVPQAIFCFLESNDFEDCLRKSISIGGDTDTIAAISCSIAESYYGIPEDIKKQALAYLPKHYKNKITEFYSILRLKEILLDLNICHDEFWEYMRTRTKRVNYPLNSEMWGTFIDNKVGDSEQNIRILVPTLTSDFSYKINIHEYAHAYELFILLQEGKELANINIKESEEFAISKEDEYQLKKVL